MFQNCQKSGIVHILLTQAGNAFVLSFVSFCDSPRQATRPRFVLVTHSGPYKCLNTCVTICELMFSCFSVEQQSGSMRQSRQIALEAAKFTASYITQGRP